MNEDLEKILKELKRIQPDVDYTKRSRAIILATGRAVDRESSRAMNRWQWIFSPTFVLATATAAAIILVLAASSWLYLQSNQEDLVVRASELNSSIQIKLNEIKYSLENDRADLETISAIQNLLGEATGELENASKIGFNKENLEESLQKLKSAQQILIQIDKMLK